MAPPHDTGQAMPVQWIEVADWRRCVAEIYARVRATADPEAAWWHWRSERDRLFQYHPQSPLPPDRRATFKGLPFDAYDPRFRLRPALSSLTGASPIPIELGTDGTVTLEPFARTEGLADALGGELTVYWITGYGGGLFLPFADATAGSETYGGGRYLLDGIKGADLGFADGRLIADFNFAYNPSCSYSPAWVCPLAQQENRLPAPVTAGERMPGTPAA